MNIFWTAVASAILSMATFILGQIAIIFIVEPSQKQRDAIADIAFDLTYYANKQYREENEDYKSRFPLIDKFRSHACKLEATSISILWIKQLAFFRLALPMKDVIEARNLLIAISNQLIRTWKETKEEDGRGYFMENADKIRKLLKIKFD